MLPFSWRAKSKAGKDAGSDRDRVGVRLESDPYAVSHMGATEDAAWRRFAAARRREGIA
jgi:hypothetical protein